MWLSKPLYEGLPWYYIAAGLAAIGTGIYVRDGYWPVVLTSLGFVGLVGGLVLVLKRRGYRSSRSRLDLEETK